MTVVATSRNRGLPRRVVAPCQALFRLLAMGVVAGCSGGASPDVRPTPDTATSAASAVVQTDATAGSPATPDTATSAASAVVQTDATAGSPAMWGRADGGAVGPFAGDGRQAINAVVQLADGSLLAVGSDYPDAVIEPPMAFDGDPAVWRSGDRGGSWVRVAAAGLADDGSEVVSDATELAGTVAAVGSDHTEDDAAVWLSDDSGNTWARVDREGLRADNDEHMNAVAATSTHLVAVGYSDNGDATHWAWRSDNGGRTWEAVGDQFGGASGILRDLVALPTGRVVAVGHTHGDVAAVWVTDDSGATWRAGTIASAVSLAAVVVTSDGALAAVGNSDSPAEGQPGTSDACRSADAGETWSCTPLAGPWPVVDLASEPASALVAVVGGESDPAAWRSPDNGHTWFFGAPLERAENEHPRVGTLLALGDGRFVAAGSVYDDIDIDIGDPSLASNGAVWIGG